MATAEQVLAQMGKEWQDAPRSLRWQPPDGVYTEVIEEATTDIIDRGGEQTAAIFVRGRIVDGPFEGKQNSLGVFTKGWGFGNLQDMIEVLGGERQPDPLAALKFVQSKVGTVVTVQVTRSTSKKDGKTYANADVLTVLEETAAPGDAPDSAPPVTSDE